MDRKRCEEQKTFWRRVTSIPAARSAVTEITALQPEASVFFQPVESGQGACSCSVCWLETLWGRDRSSKGMEGAPKQVPIVRGLQVKL